MSFEVREVQNLNPGNMIMHGDLGPYVWRVSSIHTGKNTQLDLVSEDKSKALSVTWKNEMKVQVEV